MVTEEAVNGHTAAQIQQGVHCVRMYQVACNDSPRFTMQD